MFNAKTLLEESFLCDFGLKHARQLKQKIMTGHNFGVRDKSIIVGMAESIEKQTGERKAEQTIRQYIQVDKELPDEVKGKIRNVPNFGVGHAIQLLRLNDNPEAQYMLAEKFVQMTLQSLKQEVDKILKPQCRNGMNYVRTRMWQKYMTKMEFTRSLTVDTLG